jgi:CBS domain-containing protein
MYLQTIGLGTPIAWSNHVHHASYVVDLMSRSPVVVGPDTGVSAAVDHAARHGVHYLMVVDGYRLRGVVCSCDLQATGPEKRVAECMHSPPVTIEDQATCEECVERMGRYGVGCLPVVDWAGALEGVVTRHDLRTAGVSYVARCESCGSSHGLPPNHFDVPVIFCRRCLEQGGAVSTDGDDDYLTLGGGD